MSPEMMGGMMGGGGAMWLMPFFFIIFLIVFLVAIAFILKWVFPDSFSRSEKSGEPALDTLKMRYAKGEIDTEEFETKKKNLLE